MRTSIDFERACGDAATCKCHLCSRACSGRRMCDTCIRFSRNTGNEEVSYQQLISECIGGKILAPADAFICSVCVYRLRQLLHFKEQVSGVCQIDPLEKKPYKHAISIATNTPSTDAPVTNNTKPFKPPFPSPPKFRSDPFDNKLMQKCSNKEILARLNQKLNMEGQNTYMKDDSKQSPIESKTNKHHFKKTFVNCAVCGQKYHMAVWSDATTVPQFVCARCNLKKSVEKTAECRKCCQTIPMMQLKEHMDEHNTNVNLRLRSSRSTNVPEVPVSATRLSRLPSPCRTLKDCRLKICCTTVPQDKPFLTTTRLSRLPSPTLNDYRGAVQSVLTDLRQEFEKSRAGDEHKNLGTYRRHGSCHGSSVKSCKSHLQVKSPKMNFFQLADDVYV